MLVSFLFWNMGNRPLQERLAKMVRAHDVDIVMLAECAVSPNDVETALRQQTAHNYWLAPSNNEEKTRVFSRLEQSALIHQFTDYTQRLSIRSLHLSGQTEDTLLAVVHLPSRINFSDDDQMLMAQETANDIRRIERKTKITRTILVGDFNMNPFDAGMVAAQSFHGMMTKQLAQKGERKVQRKSYRFFYNPMWRFFGDDADTLSGTYYWQASNPVNHFWNLYDQVLLRPELMHLLRELLILDSDGETSLLTRGGIPDRVIGSDHLPIYFQLEL